MIRKMIPLEAIPAPQANPILFADGESVQESNHDFYQRFCVWAAKNGLTVPEYLLPQILIDNKIAPFLFERRFESSGRTLPTREEIDSYGPWYYRVEWGDVSTTNTDRRDDMDNWLLHRHRTECFCDLAADLVGEEKSALTVMDVACATGVIALEFAERGFKHVHGVELREHSIRQANYLKKSFGVKNVDFSIGDARNVAQHNADIVFCGGLLYHVTFPVELIEDLFKASGKFLIFDSLCENHPFSGFHLLDKVNVYNPLEGDTTIQLVPTYRAIIDLLRSAGFNEIYEILGSYAPHVPFYKHRRIRSFLAVKPGVKLRNLQTTPVDMR